MAGLRILFTGVLESLERDQAETLAKEYGATISKSVGPKLSYAVVGEDAGPTKLVKLKDLRIPTLGLFAENTLACPGTLTFAEHSKHNGEGERCTCPLFSAH